MIVAKLANSFTSFANKLKRNSDHNADKVWAFKAFPGHTENALFVDQLLHKIHIISNVGELINFYLDHHVHRSLGHNWSKTGNIF